MVFFIIGEYIVLHMLILYYPARNYFTYVKTKKYMKTYLLEDFCSFLVLFLNERGETVLADSAMSFIDQVYVKLCLPLLMRYS